MAKNFYIGVDVGGTKMIAGLIANSGKIINRKKIATPQDISPAETVTLLTALIKDVLRHNKLKPKTVKGIGIGIPGLVEPKTGKILRTPNMNLNGVRLKDKLKKAFKTNIAVGNDVNVGVLGEQWLGAARKARNVVGLFLGTGLGGGVIIDRKLLLGTHGAAAEMGHIVIAPNGPRCTCGNKGCLEALIGRWAIERDIKKAVKSGKKTKILKLMKGASQNIKSKVLFQALKKKDPLITKIIKDAAVHLGTACISLRHVFDPQIIVLGGGVIEACGDFMLPLVKKTFRSDKFFKSLGGCKIEVSKLGDDAVMLGAVALVRSS